MPASKWPPDVRLHKPSGQARIRWRGREVYFGPYGSAEAQIAFGRWLALNDPAQSAESPPSSCLVPAYPLICQAVLHWEEKRAPKYDPEGREPVQFRQAFRVLVAVHGSKRTDQFGADELEAVREGMNRRGWCARVINRAVVRIRTAWRWWERKGYAPPGSWGRLRALESVPPNDHEYRHTQPTRPLDEGEYEILLIACHPTLRAMVELHWLTGMRSGELIAMRPGDIDRSADVWVYRPRRHKCKWRGQSRQVPLGPACQALLVPYLASKGPDDWVFPSSKSNRLGARPVLKGPRRYTIDNYSQAFKRAAQRVGLVGVRPYQIRHSAKRRLVRLYGLDRARAMLGQKSLETTNEYSSQIDLDIASDVAREVG